MVTALVNHLWQSTLFALLAAALVMLLRRESAALRYWVWWAASVKFLVPFGALVAAGELLAPAVPAVGAFVEWTAPLERLAEPVEAGHGWTPVLVGLIAAWMVGVAAIAGVWSARWLKIRSMVRSAAPWSGALRSPAGAPFVKCSSAQVEPAVVGVVRPVLVLPRAMVERLAPAQLDAVIEHELCHWRRRDNLTAAVHMIVAAVFWFHPLVWWIGKRLLHERERACDEAVIAAGHDRATYAEAILDVCELCVASPLACAAGVGGADLKRRLTDIMTRAALATRLRLMTKAVLTAAVACVLGVPIAIGALGGNLAFAQDDDAENERGNIAILAPDERELIPLVRIAPNYPPEALAAGLEGSVTLEFTILPNGSTANVVAIDSTLPIFEEAAITALLRWRYQPRPEALPGVRTMIRFMLEPEIARSAPSRDRGPAAVDRIGGQELLNPHLAAFTPQEMPLVASQN